MSLSWSLRSHLSSSRVWMKVSSPRFGRVLCQKTWLVCSHHMALATGSTKLPVYVEAETARSEELEAEEDAQQP